MCQHKRLQIAAENEDGYAQRICLDCGENLGEIPSSYYALDKIYGLNRLTMPRTPKDDSFYYARSDYENTYLKRRR